ncbi:MAG: TRAP transporter substrate-binding protein DctP [Clostridiaceae bacterium]|nr:TRAP transporter substrate-binding protein DctP [Clostridiaceae bacterium]
MKFSTRSLLLIICLVFAMTSLMACSAPASAPDTSAPAEESKEKVWKIAHIRPAGAVADVDIRAFAEDVSSRTDGKLKLEVYPASQLGDYTVVQERVAIGDIEMQVAPIGTNLDKGFGISNAPYLVENWEQANMVYATGSVLINEMAARLEKNDIKLLGTYPLYFGGIALGKEPKEPENAEVPKGIKIRVPAMKSFELAAEALGYIATPLPWADTFTSFQTGIVEGAIGAGAEGYYSNLKDLMKCYLPLNDHFEMWYIYVNKEKYESLPDDEQKALLEAAQALEKKRFTEAEEQEKEYEDKLAALGITIVEFSDEELAAFAKKCREKVWPEIKGDFGEGLFETVTKDIK